MKWLRNLFAKPPTLAGQLASTIQGWEQELGSLRRCYADTAMRKRIRHPDSYALVRKIRAAKRLQRVARAEAYSVE